LAAIERKESETKKAKHKSIVLRMKLASILGNKNEIQEILDGVRKDLF
jgi:hypothetical protein